MKKAAIVLIILLIIPVFAADIGDYKIGINTKRLIVEKSRLDKNELDAQGCKVKHSLHDIVAVDCPTGAKISNSRESRIFRIVDMQSDVQIGADKVWAQGIDGSGVTVVVLDTGMQSNHAELSDSIAGCQSFVSGEDCTDYNGHGTHVAGIITANGINIISGNTAKGVAPKSSVYMLKVCDSAGNCLEDDMMAAMEFAVSNNLGKIMSISIGGGNFGSHCDSDILAAKVNWVANNGVTVVVASGNDGLGVSSPACASKAVAVGAVDKSNTVTWWSNRGSALDILAPGASILSTYSCQAAGDCTKNWYAYMSGTSMSAPHVSGVAALLLQSRPTATPDEIKSAMYSTAKPPSSCQKCSLIIGGRCYGTYTTSCSPSDIGAGIVNAYDAYLTIKPAPSTTTIPTTTTTSTTTITTTSTTSTTTASTTTSTTTASTTTTTTTLESTTTTLIPTTSTSTTTTTIVEPTTTSSTTTTTLPGPSIVFSDSFENGTLNNWVQDSQSDWFISRQRATNGIRSAEVDGLASDATLTTSQAISLSDKTSASLTFSWFIENNWDQGEYICLDMFSNGVWNNGMTGSARCLDGNIDEGSWHNENIDLSSYLTSDFKIRFRSKVSSSNEDGNVDNIVISAA